MAEEFQECDNVRFFLGDVQDRHRIMRAFSGIEYVMHAAATKIVRTA